MTTSEECPARDLTSSICVHHHGRVLVYACENCPGENKLACSECVVSAHKGHRMSLLSTITSMKKERIKKRLEAAETESLRSYQSARCSIDSHSKQNEEAIQKLKLEIQSNLEELEQEIEQNTRAQLALCDTFGTQNMETLLKYRSELRSKHMAFWNHIDECKKILDDRSDVDVFLLEDDVSIPVHKAMPKLISPKFCKSDTAKGKIKDACGKVTDCLDPEAPGTQRSSHIDKNGSSKAVAGNVGAKHRGITVLSTITIPEIPRQMCTTSNGSICIGSQDKMSVIQSDRNGEVLQIINCYVEITGMSLSPVTNHVWVSGNDCSIREILVPQPILVRFFVEKVPSAICLTCDEKVLVGFPGEIKMYAIFGEHLRSSKKDRLFMPALVIFPIRISECPITHRIAVVSKRTESSSQKFIVVLNSELKEMYARTISLNVSKSLFDPIDIFFLYRSIFILDKRKYLYCMHPSGVSVRCIAKLKEIPQAMARRDNNTFILASEDKSLKCVRCDIHD